METYQNEFEASNVIDIDLCRQYLENSNLMSELDSEQDDTGEYTNSAQPSSLTRTVDYTPTSSTESSRRPSAVAFTRVLPSRGGRPPQGKTSTLGSGKNRKRTRPASLYKSSTVKKSRMQPLTGDCPMEDADMQQPKEASSETKSMQIGDLEAWLSFIHHTFETILQTTCKDLLTAWIKGIEPKKQSRYPYSGTKDVESKATFDANKIPWWWPRDGNGLSVVHREPHHLKKHGQWTCPFIETPSLY